MHEKKNILSNQYYRIFHLGLPFVKLIVIMCGIEYCLNVCQCLSGWRESKIFNF